MIEAPSSICKTAWKTLLCFHSWQLWSWSPDLTNSPPIHPSAQPPENSATLSERREADHFTMPQHNRTTTSEATQPDTSTPPQNSSINPSSLIAHRLRQHRMQSSTCQWLKHLDLKLQRLVYCVMDFSWHLHSPGTWKTKSWTQMERTWLRQELGKKSQ